MSIESDFRALLAGNAGVTTLVSTRIAQDAVPEGSTYPLVVFAVRHDRTLGLDNTLLADQAAIAVQCWAETGVIAASVADAVIAAVATAPAAAGAVVLDRASTFDPDTGLDGVALTVEWWA